MNNYDKVILSYSEVIILSVVSAFLNILAFPNTGLYFLSFIVFIPIFIIIFSTNYKKVILSGVIYSGIFFGVFLSFISYFHPAALPLVTVIMVIYYTITFVITKYLSDKFRILKYVIPAFTFSSLELIRNIGFLKFPYGIQAYSLSNFTSFIQFSDIIGYIGVSLVIFLVNGLLADFLCKYFSKVYVLKKDFKKITHFIFNRFSFIALLFVVIIIYGNFKKEIKYSKKYVKISVVQPWFDFNKSWNNKTSIELFNKLINNSKLAKIENPDMIVWPESAVYDYYALYLKYRRRNAMRFYRFFRGFNSYILTGVLHAEKSKSLKDYLFFNSGMLINKKGNIIGRYDKKYLVPFSEWFPYGKYIPFLQKLIDNAGGSDFSQGKLHTIFRHPKFQFALTICYEDCFTDINRIFVLNGAEILFNLTNDAWAYSKKAELVHFAFSIFRAIENRRTYIRSANAGVSAYINPQGKVKKQFPLFKEGFFTVNAGLSNYKTIFVKFGYLFKYVILGSTLILFILSFFIKNKVKDINISNKKN